ncbi:hypothetical protein FRC09_017935 [Ceratobasidium sp. 395]|nr:hypothetical protein FRC09_017935 [Ceratobasidium sp. 395]
MSDYPNHLVLFAVPVHGNLRGPVDLVPGSSGDGLQGVHRCAGHRFYEGWEENEFEPQAVSEIDCFPNCTSEVDDDLPSPGTLVSSLSRNQPRSSSNQRSTTSYQAPTSPQVSEEANEDAQMRAAVEASWALFQREQQPGESSTDLSTDTGGESYHILVS